MPEQSPFLFVIANVVKQSHTTRELPRRFAPRNDEVRDIVHRHCSFAESKRQAISITKNNAILFSWRCIDFCSRKKGMTIKQKRECRSTLSYPHNNT